MTVRGKILLFAAVAVGLVAVLGGTLFSMASRGLWSTQLMFSMHEQNVFYGGLISDSMKVPHALLDAHEKGQDTGKVLDEQLRRIEADFAHLRELVRQQMAPEALPAELARIDELNHAHLGWMRRMAARLREFPAGGEDRLLHESLDAFEREVLPLLDKAWKVNSARQAEHKRWRFLTLHASQVLGAVVPLVALVLVFLMAATLIIPLRRSSRELTQGAERIGRGDFTTELLVSGDDEYSTLARAFNGMAAELRDTVREKERLAKAEAEASEREMRRYNALLEETVRQRTAQLEEANAQLLFADRLVTMGQLAAGVGHEINNPLAFILGNLGFAREELGRLQGAPSSQEREELLAALAEAHEGAERVRLLAQDLKLLSHADDGASGPVDLGAVLRSASKMATHEIRYRARLVMESDGLPPVRGNAARLCQVFLNLLINAAHAIAPGQVERNEIKLLARAGADARVSVEVSDTGCGIAAEDLERIFRPFFTTKPAGVGSGLGLSVCQRIIVAHGGELTVESVVGRGTTFRVVLPAHVAEQEPRAGAMAA
ncbi:HAMP domain-containing protein [Archangium violaceum]|uniref:sensor histidine kinase n=1 Tax=Archangium violaceum TaxID=83451 RepID=UPI00193B558F|nr:ATP-binding protein [Archangium violaceum]QRK03970.1 HAMP domain-containing protein [Archangium violaceum]